MINFAINSYFNRNIFKYFLTMIVMKIRFDLYKVILDLN